jgi:hypothetical protein
MFLALAIAAALALASTAAAQTTTDPFPAPIAANDGAITVNFREFAALPDVDGQAARPMLLVDEPGTRRLFVNDMRGPIYSVSYDGKTVGPYLDVNAPNWGVSVQSAGRERGLQSFAFHPQFRQAGTRGFGKLYTFTIRTVGRSYLARLAVNSTRRPRLRSSGRRPNEIVSPWIVPM